MLGELYRNTVPDGKGERWWHAGARHNIGISNHPHPNAKHNPIEDRHNYLYFSGIMRLTLHLRLSRALRLLEVGDQRGERAQVRHPKVRTAGCDRNRWIGRDNAGPGRLKRSEAPIAVVEVHAIDAPGLAPVEQLKLLVL